LLLLTITATAQVFALTTLNPLQETMRIALGLSDNQIGLLQGPAVALPMVLGTVPLGLAIDRYSRARLTFLLAVLCVAGSVLTAVATSFTILFLARFVIGLTSTATITTAYSLLADLYTPVQRGRASMMVVLGEQFGTAGAFVIGGVLLTRFGTGPNGWRWAQLGMTVPLIPVALLVLALHEPPRTAPIVKKPAVRESFVKLWHYRWVFLPLATGIVMATMANSAPTIWAAPMFARKFSLSPDRIGTLMAVAVLVSGILGPLIGGPLTDVCQRTGGPRRTISVLSALALVSVPAGFFSVTRGAMSATILLSIFMTILIAIVVAGSALLTIVVPTEVLGLSMSILAGDGMLFGNGLAPVTVSWLSGALGGLAMIGKAMALVCVSTTLFGALTFAFGRRYLPPRRCSETLPPA
jgi:MFS family permease